MIKYKDDLFGKVSTTKNINPLTTVDISHRCYELDVELLSPTGSIIDTKAVFIQGDTNSSVIKAKLLYNGKPFKMDGYEITVNVQENAGMVDTFICENVEVVNSIVYINIPTSYVDEPGNNIFELTLQKKDNVIVSQKYKYQVLESLGEGYIGDEQVEMTALQQLIKQVQVQHDNIMSITANLEVSSTDIDDIINMIG